MAVQLSFLVFVLFCVVLRATLALTPGFADRDIRYEHIKQMDRRKAVLTHSVQKRSTGDGGNSVGGDAQCDSQEQNILKKLTDSHIKKNFAQQYAFPDESKYSIALVWVEENTQKILVAVTEETILVPIAATVYLSSDGGRSFQNITSKIDTQPLYLKKSFGLQKNPDDSGKIFLLAHADDMGKTLLYTSTDAAENFQKKTMLFTFNSNFQFHASEPGYMLARDFDTLDLYLTKNYGTTWEKIREKVTSYRWSSYDSQYDLKDCIYVATDKSAIVRGGQVMSSESNTLEKTADGGKTWQDIHSNIVTFGAQGEFLYASIKKEENTEERYMEVSTDSGMTWAEVQLPTITEDRFYSLLDMSEGKVFMHVDDPGDTGVGSLYSSDGTGIVFSLSLNRHLYPNYEDLTDFYKVESMRGVYISSQLNADQSIRSMITYDRGGEWKPIKRPDGVPCHDENKECYLQIHHQYSINRGVPAIPPKSVESAVGIILVHAHVASSLQTYEPDVYVSSDGGYNWSLALKGPHHYEIADQGGLIVAVSAKSTTPKEVKFSTDEGRCWHTYTFTDEDIVFTGLLTEPGNKAMEVAIWGYGQSDRNWRVNVIDFEAVITQKCMEGDYESWTAHSDNGNDGCLLGRKETFQRLKYDSWCLNGHAREITSDTTHCQCTSADYDCDYAYKRDGNEKCVRDPTFKTDDIKICNRGHEEKLLYLGYHKIPGDVCEGGFTPPADKVVKLQEVCQEGDKTLLELEEGLPTGDQSAGKNAAVGILVTLIVLALLAVLGVFVFRKYGANKRSNSVYRYSSISAENNEVDALEKALAAHTSLYEDSSEDEQPRRPANGAGGVPGTSGHTNPVMKSYHDDSDEDMLI